MCGRCHGPPDARGQWWFAEIRAAAAWHALRHDVDVTVGVIDVGVEIDHPYLAGRLCSGWNFVDGNDDVLPPRGRSHGTQIAGIIAQLTLVNPRVKIMPLRTRGAGRESLTHLVSALRYAIEHGVQVVNVSYRLVEESSSLLEATLEEARANGIIIVVSAGNENADLTAWPRLPASIGVAHASTIVVQAAGRADYWYADSNFSPTVPLLAAPGVSIYTTTNDGWRNMEGTSAAAPIVAGSIALLLSDARLASRARDMRQHLFDSARKYVQECPARAHQEPMRLLDLNAALRSAL